jgi:hypothetical protein
MIMRAVPSGKMLVRVLFALVDGDGVRGAARPRSRVVISLGISFLGKRLCLARRGEGRSGQQILQHERIVRE